MDQDFIYQQGEVKRGLGNYWRVQRDKLPAQRFEEMDKDKKST